MGQRCVEGLVVRTVSAHLRVRMGQVLYHVGMCEREGKTGDGCASDVFTRSAENSSELDPRPSLSVLRCPTLVTTLCGVLSLPSWFSRDTGSVSDPLRLFAPLCSFLPGRLTTLLFPTFSRVWARPGLEVIGSNLSLRFRMHCILTVKFLLLWLLSCCP